MEITAIAVTDRERVIQLHDFNSSVNSVHKI